MRLLCGCRWKRKTNPSWCSAWNSSTSHSPNIILYTQFIFTFQHMLINYIIDYFKCQYKTVTSKKKQKNSDIIHFPQGLRTQVLSQFYEKRQHLQIKFVLSIKHVDLLFSHFSTVYSNMRSIHTQLYILTTVVCIHMNFLEECLADSKHSINVSCNHYYFYYCCSKQFTLLR